jgi:ribosomal protein S14
VGCFWEEMALNEEEQQELMDYAEGRKSLESVTDRRFNMYYLKLRCQACGAPRGVRMGVSGTFTRGMTLKPTPGDKGISSCLRCGKARMMVVNDPPRPRTIKKPRGWNTSRSVVPRPKSSPGQVPDGGDTERLKL